MGSRASGWMVRLRHRLAATCFMMRRAVRRENGLRPIDLSERVCAAYRCEVDVCTPPEPHGLGDGMLK